VAEVLCDLLFLLRAVLNRFLVSAAYLTICILKKSCQQALYKKIKRMGNLFYNWGEAGE